MNKNIVIFLLVISWLMTIWIYHSKLDSIKSMYVYQKVRVDQLCLLFSEYAETDSVFREIASELLQRWEQEIGETFIEPDPDEPTPFW